MKCRAMITTALATLLFTTPASAGLIDILPNGGFETGTLDPFHEWNPSGDPIEDHWTITTDNTHSGDYAVFCGADYSPWLRQDINNGPLLSEIQEHSYWVKLTNEPSIDRHLAAAIEVTHLPSGIGYGFEVWFFDLPVGEWTQLEPDLSQFASGEYASDYRIEAFQIIPIEGCSMLVDDIVLAVPEPACVSMMAIGAVCLMRRRRR